MFLFFYKKIFSFICFCRANIFNFLFKSNFSRIGRNCSIFLSKESIIKNVYLGDSCWLETVLSYAGVDYNPNLSMKDVRASNNVHISCCNEITIEENVLIGSNVYIGDHAHGYSVGEAPHLLPLKAIGSIFLGRGTWVCDGVVILSNTHICEYSVISANSVVKNLISDRPCIIAGNPAKIIKYL